MKKHRFYLHFALTAICLTAISITALADDPVLVGASEIKAGMELYLECGPTAYNGKYMVAHPTNANANAVMCDEALTDVGTAAQWVFESAGGYDAIYTDKPLFYLKDVTTGK